MFRSEREAQGRPIVNHVARLYQLAEEYSSTLNIAGELQAAHSASHLVLSLYRSVYGYDQYINACDRYDSHVHLQKGQPTDQYWRKIKQHQQIVDFYVRGVCGELWNSVELALRGNKRRPLPGLENCKPRTFSLVRNKLILHMQNGDALTLPDSGKGATISKFRPFEGPVIFPNVDLDGKGTYDPGFEANTLECVAGLGDGMQKYMSSR